jgi:hypothetical protein
MPSRMRPPRLWVSGAGVALAILAGLVLAAPASAAAAWTPLASLPTQHDLHGVSCPDATHCWAVGSKTNSGDGVIVNTSNGGASWAKQTSVNNGQNLNAIDCTSITNCWAVGDAGLILYYDGTNWSSPKQANVGAINLQGISCADASHCWAVGAVNGGNGVIDFNSGGGNGTWVAQTSTGAKQLNAIDCPSTTTCWAVGNSGLILHTSNGTAWTSQTSGTTTNLFGVSCPSSSACWAVGGTNPTNGIVDATIDTGANWATQTSTGGQQLNAVSCLKNTTHCWAVGANGLVLATSDGTSWTSQTSNTTTTLTGVSFFNDASGWAVGAGGVIDASSCGTGALGLPTAGPVAFSTTLNGRNQTTTTTAPVTVDDETTIDPGWHLSLTSTTFTSGVPVHTLPITSATLTGISEAAGTGNCTLAANSVGYPITVPAATSAPAAAKIYNAAAGTGAGPINLTLSLSLAVLAKALSGPYTSTWTFTAASGP